MVVERRAAAAVSMVVVAVAVAMTVAVVADTVRQRADRVGLLQGARQQRLTKLVVDLSEGEDQSLDGGFELDYGKESGIEEAMTGARDDQDNIMMMKAPGELGGDVNREKLERLEKKMARFEAKEAAFLKVAQKPAQVTLSVTAGPPGKQGKRGFRGQSGLPGATGVSGVRGKTGATMMPFIQDARLPKMQHLAGGLMQCLVARVLLVFCTAKPALTPR